LPPDEKLFQYSRRPGPEGEFKGFKRDLDKKINEKGLSCQVASECGNDPVRGWRQFTQSADDALPPKGTYYRETTVDKVQRAGGRVEYDGYPGNPDKLPPGHGTIYDLAGKAFDKIWSEPIPLLPLP
jgi:hypothetical protein